MCVVVCVRGQGAKKCLKSNGKLDNLKRRNKGKLNRFGVGYSVPLNDHRKYVHVPKGTRLLRTT